MFVRIDSFVGCKMSPGGLLLGAVVGAVALATVLETKAPGPETLQTVSQINFTAKSIMILAHTLLQAVIDMESQRGCAAPVTQHLPLMACT
jgi:hypothetical protein